MRMVRCALLVFVTLIAPLFAEEIQLKDGTKITGKITGVSGDIFQVKTAYGDIKVPRSDVVTITFPENEPKKEGTEKTGEGMVPIDESLNGDLYTNHTANFEINVPEGWMISSTLRGSKDIVAALSSADKALFFLATMENFAGNLSTYAVFVETHVKSSFNNYQKVEQSPSKLDGRDGLRLVFLATAKDNNTTLKFMVYIIPYEGRMLRLSFFTLEPLFNDAVPTFEKIAASYRTLKTGGTSGE